MPVKMIEQVLKLFSLWIIVLFVADSILIWESPFVLHLACKKIFREKKLSSYFKIKQSYIEPVEKIVSYDNKTGKTDYSNTFNMR